MVCRGEQAPYEAHFKWLDYTTLGGYLLLMVGMGVYFSRRGKSTDDFFLGGRRIPWWVAGISIRATQISSIGFMTIPAKIFATNMAYFQITAKVESVASTKGVLSSAALTASPSHIRTKPTS